jgi:hypothetical protein
MCCYLAGVVPRSTEMMYNRYNALKTNFILHHLGQIIAQTGAFGISYSLQTGPLGTKNKYLDGWMGYVL